MSEYSNYRKPPSHPNPYYCSRDYFKDNLRVLKRNLLFCSGVPLTLTEEELKSQQYFGKYGTVLKVTLLKNIRQMSVYVTYADAWEASLAIIATNDFQLDRYHKLASIYGTIKYCKYFLKKAQCKNLPNCNYLHVYDKKNQIYINNQLPDEVFDEHYNIALQLLKQIDMQKMIKEKRLIPNSDKNDDVLPCPIQVLKRIAMGNQPRRQDNNESECGSDRSESGEDEENYANEKSASEQVRSERSCSQKQTHETVRSQTKQQVTLHNEQFPRIESIINSERKQKPKEQLSNSGKQHLNNKSPSHHLTACANNSQTMQIKLIRRILREPRSRLSLWTQNRKQTQQQINLFYKGLDELNELKQLCEWSVIRQANQQQQRVGFLMIKNMHFTVNKHYLTLNNRQAEYSNCDGQKQQGQKKDNKRQKNILPKCDQCSL